MEPAGGVFGFKVEVSTGGGGVEVATVVGEGFGVGVGSGDEGVIGAAVGRMGAGGTTTSR